MKLAPVYAVEVRPGAYLPRSQASPTADAPKLWVNRADAERQADRTNNRGGSDTARVVEFRIVPVKASAPIDLLAKVEALESMASDSMSWRIAVVELLRTLCECTGGES